MGYAQDYDRLTPKQGELLAEIAATAKESGGEPMFWVSPRGGGITEFGATTAKGGQFSTDWHGAKAALAIFEELGLIHRESDKSFLPRQGALDYPSWRKRPRWYRWLSVKWDSWESEVRGGVVTIVTSVGVSLLVAVLINLLFE